MENINYPIFTQYVHNKDYLLSIQKVFNKALENHSARILVFRVDLRLPSTCSIDGYALYDLNPMTLFIESLRSQIEAERKRKQRFGQKVHACPVRYIWARERKSAEKDHYHVMIIVSNEYYSGLGDYTRLNPEHLSGKVYTAWARAMQNMERRLFLLSLSDDMENYMPLVEFPDKSGYVIRRNQLGWQEKLFDAYGRATYLAKLDTKHYGEGHRCFGTSSN